mmetsp:Transcript_113525/g.222612  ORF Transcript_113525/g.222612 Transcript_113525/m.222612 type:complete len:293 (+) Transcript_113525:60-938(+)
MDGEHELQFSRITIGDRIGSGVTSVVYRGLLDGTEEVAIKEIDWGKGSLQDRQQLAFDREVAIMSKVNHVNLVNLFGVVSCERPLRIVTEYCGGGCCFDLLHNNDDIELSWPQQHKMCYDVASAIQYLHTFTPKIIHRDLKSLNLLLAAPLSSHRDKPHVKVSDFGLSRMQDSAGGDWGKMTVAAGTHHWMAPEVFQGSNYDEMVDVYSFAMIMFEIICREIPFEEEEPAEVGHIILKGTRPDLEAVPPDCPPALRDLMIRSWAQAPQMRPPFDVILPELEPLRQALWPRGW